MRVGIVGPVTPDSFADNLMSTLASMGHVPVSLGTALPNPTSRSAAVLYTVVSRSTTIAERWQSRIVRAANEHEVDLIVSTQGSLLPTTVSALRRGERKTALWFPDHVANLDRQMMLVSPYDAVFFKDRLLVQRLNALTEAPVHYLPEACNPAWHRPGERHEVDPVIVVAGNLYPSRSLLLERLHEAGVPLRFNSAGWPRWTNGMSIQAVPVFPVIYRDEKARVFRTAAAVLNNLHPAEMDSVNCRLFEAAGCGAVVITEHRPVLSDFFAAGEEVLDFSSFDELMDRISFALEAGLSATPVGDAAASRAHAEHTYQDRLLRTFRVLELGDR